MEVVVLDATRVGRRGLIDRKWRTRTQNVAYLQISSLSNYASIVKRAPNKVIAFDGIDLMKIKFKVQRRKFKRNDQSTDWIAIGSSKQCVNLAPSVSHPHHSRDSGNEDGNAFLRKRLSTILEIVFH